MRNKYAGTCYRCNKPVQPGDGHFERDIVNRGWRTQHAECAVKYRGTDVGKDDREYEVRRLATIKRMKIKAQGTGKVAQHARANLRAFMVEGDDERQSN